MDGLGKDGQHEGGCDVSRADVKLSEVGIRSEVKGITFQVRDEHSPFCVGVGKPGGSN